MIQTFALKNAKLFRNRVKKKTENVTNINKFDVKFGMLWRTYYDIPTIKHSQKFSIFTTFYFDFLKNTGLICKLRLPSQWSIDTWFLSRQNSVSKLTNVFSKNDSLRRHYLIKESLIFKLNFTNSTILNVYVKIINKQMLGANVFLFQFAKTVQQNSSIDLS